MSAKLNLSEESLAQIKLHYQEEYAKTLKKLKELEQVLEELKPLSLDLDAGEGLSVEPTTTHEPSKNLQPKRKYKKKRGRKSVWGKFIVNRLKATQIPLTYDQMTDHAMVVKKILPGDRKKTRQAINSAAFNLRSKADKIETFGFKGNRERYLGLKEWFEDGDLKNKYKSKIKDQA